MTILLLSTQLLHASLIVARMDLVKSACRNNYEAKQKKIAGNMSAVDVNKKSFWKRNANKVPGRLFNIL